MLTVSELWQASVARARPEPAFLVQTNSGWRPVGWKEAAQAVDELAGGFLALGIRKGDRVAIASRTRLEWTLCDYALLSIGAVSVTIYPTSSAADCAFILADAGTRAIVCEDPAQLAKLGAPPEHAILIEGSAGGAMSFDELRGLGREHLGRQPAAIAEARSRVGPDDVLTYIYTSGTTGVPKGCVLTQRNYAALVEMVGRIPDLVVAGDVLLLFLPLAHTFARTCQFVATTLGTIAYCPDVAALPAAFRSVRPTVLPGAPRLFERVYAAVLAGFERERGPKRRLIEWALGVGRRASRCRLEGRRYPRGLALQFALADRLVFSKVKGRLGGRVRHAISGGAALGVEVAEFFHALDILVLEGYGLTECSVVSVNRPDAYRFGTVGPTLPGLETKAAADGELLVRGPVVFQGYRGNPDGTREAFDLDGWLRTGDIVTIDHDGFIAITDRKRDIIVLAGGKNVSPQKIENALKASPYVSHALVVGDGRPYVTALITADLERAGGTGEDVEALVARAVWDANRGLGKEEQVRRYAVLERNFSEEAGELTPTLKVKRRVCEERYRDEIERLYAGPRVEQ